MDFKKQQKMKCKWTTASSIAVRVLTHSFPDSAMRDKLAKRYKLRVVGFVKDVSVNNVIYC